MTSSAEPSDRSCVGKLVDVGVGDAQVRVLRPQVAGFDVPVIADGFLQREIPLLRVAGGLLAIGPENTLPESGVGIRRRDLHRGAARQNKRGLDVVLRLLADGLDERKLRKREGRGDAGLFEPDHAVTGAHHPGIADAVGQSGARTEIAAFEVAGSVGKVEHLGLQIEHGALIADFRRWKVERVARAQIELEGGR